MADDKLNAFAAAIEDAVQDDSRSKAILIVTSVFLGISLSSVLLRVFVRTRIVRAFGWDDGIMLCAMVGGFVSRRLGDCAVTTCARTRDLSKGSKTYISLQLGIEPRLCGLRHHRHQVRHGEETPLLCPVSRSPPSRPAGTSPCFCTLKTPTVARKSHPRRSRF